MGLAPGPVVHGHVLYFSLLLLLLSRCLLEELEELLEVLLLLLSHQLLELSIARAKLGPTSSCCPRWSRGGELSP